MRRLKQRRDFLAAARGRSWVTRGAVVQTVARADDEGARVGFTASKKLGNAVMRNRAKRRLREAVRTALADRLDPRHDYVVIGRSGTCERNFEQLKGDLRQAVERLNQGRSMPRRDNRRSRPQPRTDRA